MEEGELGVLRVAFEWDWRRDCVLRVYFFGTYQDLARCHYHHRPTWTCKGVCVNFALASPRPMGHQVGHLVGPFVGQEVSHHPPTHPPRPKQRCKRGTTTHPPIHPDPNMFKSM